MPRSTALATAFEQDITNLIHKVAAEHEVSIHRHGGISRPPKPVDAKAEKLFGLVEECSALLGQPITRKASGGVCDGNNIAACGVPVVDTMGVRGGAIHSPDEFLIVPSLAERARAGVRVRVIYDWVGGLGLGTSLRRWMLGVQAYQAAAPQVPAAPKTPD